MRALALAIAYLAYGGSGRRVHKIGDFQQSEFEIMERAEGVLANLLSVSDPSAAWQVADVRPGSSLIQPESLGKRSVAHPRPTRHLPASLVESFVDAGTQVKLSKRGFTSKLRQGVNTTKRLERQRLRRLKKEAKRQDHEDNEVKQADVKPQEVEAFHPPPPCRPDYEALLKAVVSKLQPGLEVNDMQLRQLMGLYSRDLTGYPFKKIAGAPGRAMLNVFGRMFEDYYYVPDDAATLWNDTRPPPDVFTCRVGTLVKDSVTWLSNDPIAVDKLLLELGFFNATHIGLDTEWTPTVVLCM